MSSNDNELQNTCASNVDPNQVDRAILLEKSHGQKCLTQHEINDIYSKAESDLHSEIETLQK